ncbi:MAG: glycosyltransferase [Rhodobiaceae bacterium]|nr:glycosyltransferase [Rhodobiaceae bacterium]
MKLVHILDNLERGGAQTSLGIRVAGLARRGHEQHVICLNEKTNEQVVARFRQIGADVTVIGRLQLFTGIGFLRLVLLLRRLRPDAVHTLLPWGDLLGRTAAFLANVRPIVSTITARYADKPRLQLLLDRQTARWIDRAIFNNPDIIAFSVAHEGIRPEQVVCIPNGVESDDRDRSEAAARLRREHGAGARVIIGMIARLHPQKAHEDLLAAFARLASEVDACLWLVGDGPLRNALVAQAERLGISDRVYFAGDQDNARDWLAAIDLFVHPTHFEGLPMAVLEAMVTGKPVIASDVDGLQGLITSGVDGWLVPPGDVDALAAAMSHALDHPDEAATVARAGADRARTAFSPERVVEAYDQLLKSLAGPKASGA